MNQIFFKFSLLVTLVLQSSFAFGDTPLVQYLGNPSSNVLGVRVYNQVHVTVPNGPQSTLYLTGAGVYRKRVLFSDVNVYVITSYTQNPNGVNSSDPLATIRDSEMELIQMTMVRHASQSQARAHFEDALVVNGVNVSEPETRRLLNSIPELGSGAVSTIVSYGPNDSEQLYIRYPGYVIQSNQAKDRGLNQWRVWFGRPLDSNMAQTKWQLMSHFFSPFEIFFRD